VSSGRLFDGEAAKRELGRITNPSYSVTSVTQFNMADANREIGVPRTRFEMLL
jgi:hypothetical protein